MNKQEIIKLLIEYYIDCILRMPFFGWREYTNEKRIGWGICICANRIFNTYIYDEKWVFRNKSFWLGATGTDFMYWSPLPCTSKNYFQCMWRLYSRVRILKKELKIPE